MEGDTDPALPLWASDVPWLGLRVPTCKVVTRTAHVPWGMTRGTWRIGGISVLGPRNKHHKLQGLKQE